jgi:hypothetical protein
MVDIERMDLAARWAAILAVLPHLLLMAAVTWLVVTVMPPMQH